MRQSEIEEDETERADCWFLKCSNKADSTLYPADNSRPVDVCECCGERISEFHAWDRYVPAGGDRDGE